jgi:hypothetical protein
LKSIQSERKKLKLGLAIDFLIVFNLLVAAWLYLANFPSQIVAVKNSQVARTDTGDNGNSDHAPIISELVIP